MLKNYFKAAFRNLRKHQMFSLINITGLAVGITAAFFIFLYVRFELSYDKFNSKADRIYRLVTDIKTPSGTNQTPFASPAMAVNAKMDFPEVESFVRLSTGSLLFKKDDVQFQEDNTVTADSTFFQLFDLPLIEGNPRTALKEPLSVVLPQSTAKKYFGNSNPVGQSLSMPTWHRTLTVTGVMKDIPENSQLKADLILSRGVDSTYDAAWHSVSPVTYLLLKPGSSAQALESKFPAFLESKIGTQMRNVNIHYTLHLEPLRDVYLRSNRGGGPTGNINNVYIFSTIGIFILLVAAINFINLTTARSVERAKEVGIRKVVGEEKNSLVVKFLVESVVVALFAFGISLILYAIFQGTFNQLSGKKISEGLFQSPEYVLILLLISIGIGLLAGMYPALVLSSFNPIKVLKGRFATSSKGLFLRRGLVTTQFIVSIGLIIITLVVYTQLDYMLNKNLGFENEQTLILDTHWDKTNTINLRQEISTIPNISSVSLSSGVPGIENRSSPLLVENERGEMEQIVMDQYSVDFDYISLYQMETVAGRAFSNDFSTDSTSALMLNESAAKLLGYSDPDDVIGKKFLSGDGEGKIIGVLDDFNIRSLKEKIQPLCLSVTPRNWRYLSAKISTSELPATLKAVEDTWNRLMPYRPYEYYFADDVFDQLYHSERRFGKLFLTFAVITIFISCLGLLGLTSYSTFQRRKEIAIRKTMGASTIDIVSLLSKDFFKLVLIAILIAVPIGWYTMNQWLADFAYRIELQWWMFALAGLLAVLITFLTISFQSVKAALMNPVRSLRSE